MRFVYVHLAIYGIWIACNIVPFIPHFDPTFVILAMEASVRPTTGLAIGLPAALVPSPQHDSLRWAERYRCVEWLQKEERT
jgi:hypothetical protein